MRKGTEPHQQTLVSPRCHPGLWGASLNLITADSLLSPLARALDQLSGTQMIDQEMGGGVAMAAEGAGAGPGLLLKEEGVVPLHRSPGPASVGLPGRPFLLI